MMDWRDRLRDEIAKQGVKVTHLSSELGFSRDYISRLLKPNSRPNLDNLQKVCDGLNVSFAYIYSGREDQDVMDALINEVSGMDRSELLELKEYLDEHKLKRATRRE